MNLWTTASEATEQVNHRKLFASLRVEAVEYWPFLAEAENKSDFDNRLALIASELDRIVRSATKDGATFISARAELEESFKKDFATVEAARKQAAEKCTVCGKPATKYVGGQEGYSASGHHVCDAHADHFSKSAEYHYVKPAGGGKYKIVQKGTGKTLSVHDSKEQAESAFRAMETHMHGARDTSYNRDVECHYCGEKLTKGPGAHGSNGWTDKGGSKNCSGGHDPHVPWLDEGSPSRSEASKTATPAKFCGSACRSNFHSATSGGLLDPHSGPQKNAKGNCGYCGRPMHHSASVTASEGLTDDDLRELAAHGNELAAAMLEIRKRRNHTSSTYAQEQAERLRAERSAPFKATHTYSPIGWDQFDPKGVKGSPISSGAKVELLKEHTKGLQQGMPTDAKQMFNVVRDADGNFQHVNKKSLHKGGSKTAETFGDQYYDPNGKPCSQCGRGMDSLSEFPGDRCISCHANSPEGRAMPTADELSRMWGGPGVVGAKKVYCPCGKCGKPCEVVGKLASLYECDECRGL